MTMHTITVSVVYATREKQWIYERTVDRGTSALELLQISGFLEKISELTAISMSELELGIFSQKIEHDHLLEEGDRVEVYRPLTADPKEVRRQLAKMGKTMGAK